MRTFPCALLVLALSAASLTAQQRVLPASAVLSLPADAARMIAPGETKRSALAATDDMLSDSSHFGRWLFEGTRGQRVTVTQRSDAFDTYLLLGKQGADAIAVENDDSDDTNSEVELTLPDDGMYVIIAGSFAPQETGDYTVTLTVLPPLAGMTGPVTPATVLLREPDPMMRVGFDLRMGSQLDANDPRMDDSTHYELWYVSVNAGDEITVALESGEFSGSLYVGPQGGEDAGRGLGAIPRMTFTARASGTFVIIVKGNTPEDRGNYMLDLSRKPRAP